MERLKTVHQTQHASSLELNFFERAPLGSPGPGSSCPVGSKTCHVLLDDCQKWSRRPDQNPSTAKKQDYFKGFPPNYIPVLYCVFGF